MLLIHLGKVLFIYSLLSSLLPFRALRNSDWLAQLMEKKNHTLFFLQFYIRHHLLLVTGVENDFHQHQATRISYNIKATFSMPYATALKTLPYFRLQTSFDTSLNCIYLLLPSTAVSQAGSACNQHYTLVIIFSKFHGWRKNSLIMYFFQWNFTSVTVLILACFSL